MKLAVRVRIHSDFKERNKDVLEQLLEILNNALGFVDVIEPWNLQHQ